MKTILFMVLTAPVVVFANLNKLEKSEGVAKDQTGQVQYYEQHLSRFQDGQLVSLQTNYLDRQRRPIGSIKTNYQINPFVPNYLFKDDRNHRFVDLKKEKNKVLVKIRRSKKDKIVVKKYPFYNNMVAGQGFYFFLREKVKKFKNNPRFKEKIRFLVPFKNDYFWFRIRLLKEQGDQVTLRMEPTSWLFRLVAPRIDVTYDVQTLRLLKYRGPSNLLNAQGQTMNVSIDYKY